MFESNNASRPPTQPVPGSDISQIRSGDPGARDDAAAAALLDVRDLHVHFNSRRSLFSKTADIARAVDGVSFSLAPGRTLGLVGESGCGKTTAARAVLRLIPATSGAIIFDQQDITHFTPGQLKPLRREMQIVFQDPAGAINPRMRVGSVIAEPFVVHGVGESRAEIQDRVADLLVRCGLTPDAASRYPHEFSGGQRQRIVIARTLALNPKLIVCDEPTSALDVSVQAQILNLLRDLQNDLGLSYLFISHDMAVVKHMCDSIAVMRAGRIVEAGSREQVIGAPEHAYTKELLAAVPHADPKRARRRIAGRGSTPTIARPKSPN